MARKNGVTRRLATILVGIFVAWLSVGPVGAAMASPTIPAASYNYDSPHVPLTYAGIHDNRGPPRADDPGSIGISPRPRVTDARADTMYDHPSPLVHFNADWATASREVEATARDSSPTQPCGVATKTERKTIALGEGMEDRVIPFAKKNGADWYKPDPNAPPSQWMENNRQWINDRMDEGCRILDCGPAPGRANFPGPTSPYYQMELDEIFKRGYVDYQRVGID